MYTWKVQKREEGWGGGGGGGEGGVSLLSMFACQLSFKWLSADFNKFNAICFRCKHYNRVGSKTSTHDKRADVHSSCLAPNP